MHQFSVVRDTRGFLKAAEKWVRFRYMITDEACKRARILTFWHKHGLVATQEAFGVSRASLFRWQHALCASRGNLQSLNPRSRKPHVTRISKLLTQPGIETETLRLRSLHPKLGKEKLQPLLEEYCLSRGLHILSVASVGKLLTSLRQRRLLPTNAKVKLTKTHKLLQNQRKVYKRNRLPRGYRSASPGELIQVDTVIQFMNGVRRYLITAVDTHGKFAFAYGYSSASSATAADFLSKLQRVTPFTIKQVQTDNGSEFAKYFHHALDVSGITHFHTYPHTPKMNAFIERFNRTIQYEFANFHRDSWADKLTVFNQLLMEWLVWYNTKRVHHSLGNMTPIDYLIKINGFTPAESQMYVAHTSS